MSTDEPLLYIARRSALAEVNGASVKVTAGATVLRAGHPMLEALPDLFVPVVPATFQCHAAGCTTRTELPWCEEHEPAIPRRRRLWRRGGER